MKILVADDDRDQRKVLEVLLRNDGFDVISESNGDEALRHLFGPEPPDIAILDWMMPGHSGVDLCKRVREFSKEHYTYLILLTARGLQEDVIAGLEAGADDYLVKPYDVKEFLLRVRAGRRLIELQQELKTKNELLQDLNYALAHDLKTPLVAIDMTTTSALEGAYGAIPEDYEKILFKTKHSIAWLLRLTETMRTIAKFENTLMQTTLQELDMRDLVLRCASELEPLMKSKNISFELMCNEQSIGIVGNSNDLQRLIINLLDNAIKFTPEEGTIKIRLKLLKDNVSISICDSGPGVPESDRHHLFQRFAAGQRRGSGTGLGLYLCRRIAEVHNGKLIYEIDDELGQCFTLEMPRTLVSQTY